MLQLDESVISPVAAGQAMEEEVARPAVASRSTSRSRANTLAYGEAARACFAVLRAQCLTSAEAGSKAYSAVLASHGIHAAPPSPDTIHRATVEAGIIADYVMVKLLKEVEDLCVGIDESSKINGRSFVEIEFAGHHPTYGFLCYTVGILEVLSHTAKDMLQYIDNVLSGKNLSSMFFFLFFSFLFMVLTDFQILTKKHKI